MLFPNCWKSKGFIPGASVTNLHTSDSSFSLVEMLKIMEISYKSVLDVLEV